MKRIHPSIPVAFTGVLVAAGVVFAGGGTTALTNARVQSGSLLPEVQALPGAMTGAVASAPVLSPQDRLLAERLGTRIQKRFGYRPSTSSLLQAAKTQRMLLMRQFRLQFADKDTGAELASVRFSAEEHPRWVKIDVTPSAIRVRLDTFAMAEDVVASLPQELAPPENAVITGIATDDFGVKRAVITGQARPGYAVSMQQAVQGMRRALLTGQQLVIADVQRAPGGILNASGVEMGDLSYLASGHSDFSGSGDGRKWNVRKGLDDRLNNIVLAPGESFSFLKALGDFPRNGPWKEALGIFNGGDLLPTVGGGLCQVATTVFRAAVNSGVPITERESHSLFVHYYEMYGVGLDATIFAGKQDFTFINDTGNYLFLQAYAREEEAFVDVYGTPDGRSVQMAGPYFGATTTAFDGKRRLHGNEIGWKRSVVSASGSVSTDTFVSTYRSLPHSVVKKYSAVAVAN